MTLDPVQTRVLGALIEKEITTPEGYPLSLNALINACNQKSSRDPVLELSEESVRQALHTLEDLDLVTVSRDSRVPKFEHRARTVLNLRRDETAILCLLMLRGPQTPGELRSRCDRMYNFDDLQSVETTLARLSARPSETAESATAEHRPLVILLPRQPGSREARWMHLLNGVPDPAQVAAFPERRYATTREPSLASSSSEERLAALEQEVASLRDTIAALERKIETLIP